MAGQTLVMQAAGWSTRQTETVSAGERGWGKQVNRQFGHSAITDTHRAVHARVSGLRAALKQVWETGLVAVCPQVAHRIGRCPQSEH